MNVFVLKVGAEDCPTQIGRPSKADDWTSGSFIAPAPRPVRGTANEAHNFSVGDFVYIWVHETRGGAGITATGNVSQMAGSATALELRFEQLTLEKPPLGWVKLEKYLDDGSALKSLFEYTHTQSLWLDEDQAARFSAALQKACSDFDQARTDAALRYGLVRTATTAEEAALNDYKQEIEIEIARQYQLVERRQGQPKFRRQLIQIYAGKCCITGTKVAPILEAAHIVPFSEGRSFRDSPSNGLLLRADIHTLFDLYMLSIDPATNTVVLSEQLQETPYAKLAGRKVAVLAAAPEFLAHHFSRLTSRPRLG